MSVDGIWKVEILGPYGWEAISTAFLERGRYLSASQDHYSIGRYEVHGAHIKVVAMTHPHGQALAAPGAANARQFGFEGEINDGLITGQADDAKAEQTLTIRGTRLGSLRG